MKLRFAHMSSADLQQAGLGDIVETLLAREPEGFTASLAEADRDAIAGELDAFAAFLGWTPPRLAREWRAVELALDTSDSDACWTGGDQSLEIDFRSRLPDEPSSGYFLAGYAEGLFAGLFKIAEDAAGDTALVSMLPMAQDMPVLAVQHDSDDLPKGQALRSYLVDIALSPNDPEPGESPGWVGLDSYMRIHAVLSGHDAGHAAAQIEEAIHLYARSRWTIHPLFGETSPPPASHLVHAPGLDAWEQERQRFADEPFRLNYWIVAHLLLGNEADAAVAAQLAAGSRAQATRWLGEEAARILAGRAGAHLGLLHAEDLRGFRQSLRDAAPADVAARLFRR
jgi:hypothetical protein